MLNQLTKTVLVGLLYLFLKLYQLIVCLFWYDVDSRDFCLDKDRQSMIQQESR